MDRLAEKIRLIPLFFNFFSFKCQQTRTRRSKIKFFFLPKARIFKSDKYENKSLAF